MHYWNLPWDWNNLDSVRTVHSFLEGWALVFFALLVAFDVLAHQAEKEHPARAKRFARIGLWSFGVAVFAEILAYPYSQRNDTLSEKIIVSLSELAGTADKKARQALGDSSVAITQSGKAVDASGQAKTSASKALALARGVHIQVDSIKKSLTALGKQADDIRDEIAWRHVSPEEASAIRKSIPASIAGLKIEVRHMLSDPEAATYASEIADALRPVLSVNGTSGMLAPWGTIPQGVGLYVSSVDIRGAADIQRALKAGGIDAPGALLPVTGISSDTGILVFVWPKPHPQKIR